MNPCVAFVQDGDLWLWWFDSVAHAQVFTEFSGEQPRVAMDDKRTTQSLANDILFTYIRDDKLYYREQRDRFGVEYLLTDGTNGRPADVAGFDLIRFGMNSVNRMQWGFRPKDMT
jgi:hypothetical protein